MVRPGRSRGQGRRALLRDGLPEPAQRQVRRRSRTAGDPRCSRSSRMACCTGVRSSRQRLLVLADRGRLHLLARIRRTTGSSANSSTRRKVSSGCSQKASYFTSRNSFGSSGPASRFHRPHLDTPLDPGERGEGAVVALPDGLVLRREESRPPPLGPVPAPPETRRAAASRPPRGRRVECG